MTDWQLGMLAFREGRLREAVDRLQRSTAEHERTVSQVSRFETYAYLGAALYALGRPAEAVTAFETALHLNPATLLPVDLTVNLANAYLASGRRQAAEQTLNAVLQEKPGNMEAHVLLKRIQGCGPDDTQRLHGSVLGETPESILSFINSLSFSNVANGYAPTEVHTALAELKRYVEFLSSLADSYQQTITQNAVELDRLRQIEENYIHSMFKGPAVDVQVTGDEPQSELTPLEKLFQKKT